MVVVFIKACGGSCHGVNRDQLTFIHSLIFIINILCVSVIHIHSFLHLSGGWCLLNYHVTFIYRHFPHSLILWTTVSVIMAF